MDSTFLQRISREINRRYSSIADISNHVADGTIKRYDLEKPGDTCLWLAVHPWNYKGNTYYSAIWGNWKDGNEYKLNSFSDSQKEFPKDARKAMEDTAKKNAPIIEAAKLEKNKACREKWSPIYYRDSVPGPHEYLTAKGFDKPFLTRVDAYGTLLVPIWSPDGIFEGVQRIFRDPVSGDMEKRYSGGIKIIGSFCPFGDIRNAEYIYIAEGFATAATIHVAMNMPTVAAMSANNLLPVAKSIRLINPNCKIIFAADKDRKKGAGFMVGEKYAATACHVLANAIFRVPKFSVDNEKWTDFNDLHLFEGIERVQAQLTVSMSDFIEVIPLGFNDAKNYYFVSHKKQIIELGKSDHNAPALLLNAPAKYWGNKYGYQYKANGEASTNPDWKQVIEKLGLEIAEKGVFDHSNIRGRGVWKEKGGLVVNVGDKIFHKGESYPIFKNDLKSKFFYESGKTIKVDLTKRLTDDDRTTIMKAFTMLNYKSKKDSMILLGFLYSAQFFAALDWRPHVWVTGPRGCGKSHILHYIDSALLFSMAVQDSTASGIRQALQSDAFTIIYDESEPNTEKDRLKMSEILSLARQCSTGKDYQTLRGSAGGKSVSYNTNANFFMGSIQSSAMNAADLSRFFVIEMNEIAERDEATVANFKEIERLMLIVGSLKETLFSHAVSNFDFFEKNVQIAKAAVKSRGFESRFADQLSPILAGYYGLIDDGLFTESYVLEMLDYMNFQNSEYIKENSVGDSEKCFDSILDVQIVGRGVTVGQAVERAKFGENALQKLDGNNMLALIGLHYDDAENSLAISTFSHSLKKELEKNQFSDYVRILKRHPRVLHDGEPVHKRINGKPTRSIAVMLGNYA